MNKIYGNDTLLTTFRNMVLNEKCPHSVMFCGETGTGKKLMADYYIQQLLCENLSDGKPCGVCASCRNAENHTHPDVVYVGTEGKSESYTVSSARKVIKEAFVKPNNKSGRRVFVFRDCRKMSAQTQNILLKIIEEPPDYAYFILTATSKYEFLETIISRCICFSVTPCSESEAVKALAGMGYSQDEIKSAVSHFHGNIGRCIAYITDKKVRAQTDLTKRIADSIIKGSEYELNVVFTSAGTVRNELYDIFSALDMLMRDCAVLYSNRNAEVIGLFREQALRLSEIFTPSQAVRIHGLIENSWNALQANVSVPLVIASLCAEIMAVRSQE